MDGEPPAIPQEELTGEKTKTPESVPFHKVIDYLGDANGHLDSQIDRWQGLITKIETKQEQRTGLGGALASAFDPLDASTYRKELEGVQGEKRAVTSALLGISSGNPEEAEIVLTKTINRSLQGLAPSLFGKEDSVTRNFRRKMIEKAQRGNDALRQINPEEAAKFDKVINTVDAVNSFMSGPEIV
ncbi:hypothetical protein HY469_03915 [Candidatus Roizmanbacteria bacterium]|nr:hypothetical protein [Candidatus Roizmanbacteria bacterium]